MRDGVALAADIYLEEDAGPLPALLMRTPYNKRVAEFEAYAHPIWYARQGFAVVCQDVRGCFASEGEFTPFFQEALDGYDTVEWVASQPWCNGRVGSYGFSYPGATQLLAAGESPPHLAAMAPAMTGSSYHEGWTYRGGALQLAFVLSWAALLARHQALRAEDSLAVRRLDALLADPSPLYRCLPLTDAADRELAGYAPFLSDWLAHPGYDDFWAAASPLERYAEMRVPALHVAGWYDIFLEGTLDNYRALAAAGNASQSLLIGPWYHMPWMARVDGVDFGPEARNIVDEAQLRFFRRTLCDEPDDGPAVRLFVMGENRWRSYADWPPRDRELALFLRSDGRANSLNGNGRLSGDAPPEGELADWWSSDPDLPLVSMGGRGCCTSDVSPMGPADQRSQESRNDMLVYTSAALDEALTVIGTPSVSLHSVCDSIGSDLVVRLVDVHPDGTALNVSDGVARVAWDPGSKPTETAIRMSPTAIRFEQGHRIRLDVAGSSFPMHDRNPGNGMSGVEAREQDFRVVTQAVFHDAMRPSRLTLPVVA
jgi:uncharacterized protein